MPRKRLYKSQSGKTKKSHKGDSVSDITLDSPAPRQKVSYSIAELELLDRLKDATGYTTRSRYIHDTSLGYRPPTNDITRQTDRILLLLHKIIRSLSGIDNNINQIAKHTNTSRALQPEDMAELIVALKTIPKIKEDIATAAHLIVSMTCPTEQEETLDP
ncbi:MAG: MobC family plasmid mobilization relaxosome protein [Rhizobiales bacterium]|nr:MobC family plasmid mobilization relaxosome protein [Hyphomicrobiales bacterium]